MKKGILAILGLCALIAIVPGCGKKDSKKTAKPAAAKKAKTPRKTKASKKSKAPKKSKVVKTEPMKEIAAPMKDEAIRPAMIRPAMPKNAY